LDLQRQFVERASELERHLVVLVVYRCASVSADVEVLVPLEDQRQCVLHLLARNLLAVDLEDADATATDAAQVVEGERSHAQSVMLEVELERVPAGRQCLGAFPANALQVGEIP